MTEGQDSRLIPLIGGLGILMVAAGIVVGTVQALRPAPATALPDGGAPALAIVAPAAGDTVDSPVTLRFTAGDRLALGPMGWASDQLHLHAYVNGTEVMPAAADIEEEADGVFRWTLPVPPGSAQIQLRWAGMSHGAIEDGASAPVPVVVRRP